MDSVDACQAARPHVIDEKQIKPKRAVPREEEVGNTKEDIVKMYVAGVKDGITEDDIRNYFSAYGNITECEVHKDKETGQNRGFAFVTFDDYDPVEKCVIEKNHQIAGKRCDVKRARPKGEAPMRGGGGYYDDGYKG